jgi:hypothetical protein
MLLTTQEHSTLTDDELMVVARQVATANDMEGGNCHRRLE